VRTGVTQVVWYSVFTARYTHTHTLIQVVRVEQDAHTDLAQCSGVASPDWLTREHTANVTLL
jgi:hypothetical protein